MKAHFKIFRSLKNKQYYFNYVGTNGQVMLQSEGYKRIFSARKAIASLKKHLSNADILQ
jgi:uncharacterized protein YegP (UPF0339 family)